MKTFEEIKDEICGHPTLTVYEDLKAAVEISADEGPFLQGSITTKLYPRVSERVGKSQSAVSKNLSRARDDIWNYGDWAALTKLLGKDKLPFLDPNELVEYLAAYFRNK